MRIIKDYDQRKSEILDTAERMFQEKGYTICTINDIIKELDIAKGTFYYYFKSKEEVLDAIVLRIKEGIRKRGDEIVNNNDLIPEVKLMMVFMAMSTEEKVNNDMLNELHKTENALLHQKSLSSIVAVMTPLLVKIIQEGIKKQVWKCKYPLEYMQIFLASSLTLTDDGIFEIESNSKLTIMMALISMLEKMLEVTEGKFINMFVENWK